MANVYDSLKGTLQWSKANSMAVARVKGSDASSLENEMEQLEKFVVDRLGRLRAAVKEGEAVVAGESQHVEQVIEGLRTEIAAQEAQLNAARGKELATQKMEQTLTVKIHDLQNDVKKKEEALESRGKEVSDLKSKIDVLGKQITQSELAVQQAKAETGSEAKRAQQLAESSNAKIATLEAQRLVKNKETVLADQDRQIKDLNSQLGSLTNGIKGMSTFFKQAEALTQELKREKEPPANAQSKSAEVASNLADAAREAVSPGFFDSVTKDLAEINGPLASMIVRDQVKALGESMEKFPKTRVTELVKVLSEEIADENVKIRFRKRIAEKFQSSK